MVNLTELLVVLILALLLLGKPDKIPEYARAVSKAVKDLKSASAEIKNDVTETTECIVKTLDEKEAQEKNSDSKIQES